MKLLRRIFIAILFVLALGNHIANATEQINDIFIENGKQYMLSVSWTHPSPLQVLYIRTDTKSPFRWHCTSNYRGHVATWQICDSALYLISVNASKKVCGEFWSNENTRIDTMADPSFFGIKSLSGTAPREDGSVFADWFSGVLEITTTSKWKRYESGPFEEERFIYIRNGKLVKDVTLTPFDQWWLQEIEDDVFDDVLKKDYPIVYLYNCFLSYYLRAGLSQDKVEYGKHQGRFPVNDYRTMLMLLYDNDPLQFPFNWENFEKNGAPVCTWIIKNNSLFLSQVTLQSGGLFEYDEENVSLSELFQPEQIVNNRVLASWMNGEFVVEYGEEIVNDFGMKEFKVERKQTITLNSGRIVKTEWSPSAFGKKEKGKSVAERKKKH
jgi:hypothetical protein